MIGLGSDKKRNNVLPIFRCGPGPSGNGGMRGQANGQQGAVCPGEAASR